MNKKIQLLVDNIEKVIIGKNDSVIKVITAMLAGGHVLIKDVPGVGKTQLVSALARSLDGKFNRIQLTPDIMPSDITGFSMINPQNKQMEYRHGVAMCNFLLADEINRASPKTQSSLLEIMEEAQISIDGNTYSLPKPFMLLATQNPIETYGTYCLPEAQMDRFLIQVSMGYPDAAQEKNFLNRTEYNDPLRGLNSVMTLEEVRALQEETQSVNIGAEAEEYILRIVTATRNDEDIALGVSPRGSMSLCRAAKSFAYIFGRSFITPDDIKDMATCVLAHRIILSSKGKMNCKSGEQAIDNVLKRVPVPPAK